jgi:hypothetical protein
MSLNNRQFGAMVEHLENREALGHDEWKKTLSEAYTAES